MFQFVPKRYLQLSVRVNYKMTARIQVWSTRHLSYMARCDLINLVLISLHLYWAQVFILLQKVLEEVARICRDFLWSGQHYIANPGLVAWEQLCNNKDSGGLGFRDVKV